MTVCHRRYLWRGVYLSLSLSLSFSLFLSRSLSLSLSLSFSFSLSLSFFLSLSLSLSFSLSLSLFLSLSFSLSLSLSATLLHSSKAPQAILARCASSSLRPSHLTFSQRMPILPVWILVRLSQSRISITWWFTPPSRCRKLGGNVPVCTFVYVFLVCDISTGACVLSASGVCACVAWVRGCVGACGCTRVEGWCLCVCVCVWHAARLVEGLSTGGLQLQVYASILLWCYDQ